jgi:hypothetical protein
MAAPIINVISATASRIGAASGKDTCDVVFQSDQDLYEWEARADGAGIRQGLLVGFSPITSWQQLDDLVLSFDRIELLGLTWDDLDALREWNPVDTLFWSDVDAISWDQLEGMQVLDAGADGTIRVDNEELTSGDKSYRINIYGKNGAGEWTAFG